MRRHDERPDRWPIFLWIAWKEGEAERIESLCRAHRAYVFETYPATAHGLKRRGEQCGMCPAQPARDVTLPGPRGHGLRGSSRHVSPIRHRGCLRPDAGRE
jgi:hypothetical protein